MQPGKHGSYSRVTVVQIDESPEPRYYHRMQYTQRARYIAKMRRYPSTRYIDIMPREYSKNKISFEASGGAYDYEKAKQVLGL